MAATAAPPLFTISELARELGISTRAIRFYEEKGLISPSRTRGNQRRYRRRDRARLKLILRGKRFGYSLDQIAEMIGMAEVNLDEAEQIRRSLAYGHQKLDDLRQRQLELGQLEQEILAVRQRLLERLAQLEPGQAHSLHDPNRSSGSRIDRQE